MTTETMMRPKEVCDFCGISLRSIAKMMVHLGLQSYETLPGRHRFKKSEVEAALERSRRTGDQK